MNLYITVCFPKQATLVKDQFCIIYVRQLNVQDSNYSKDLKMFLINFSLKFTKVYLLCVDVVSQRPLAINYTMTL